MAVMFQAFKLCDIPVNASWSHNPGTFPERKSGRVYINLLKESV